jgi:voltage-gated potassium channel
VTPAPPTDLSAFERSHLVTTGARAALTATVLLALYFVLPVAHRSHESPVLRLGVALALFVAVLVNEIRLISSHERPMLRAAVAMATVIPLFLVLFAWIYLTMSHADPSAFSGALTRGGSLTRASALYFTVTVFSTVGFGDIAPKTDAARLVVTVQMLADLAVIAVVIRLIFGAVTRGEARKLESVGDPGPAEPAEE